MKAITREEKIMSGENLTPITRKELFLAKAAGQNVETPQPATREEMFLSKIGGGSGGATINNQDKTITENGVYQADEGYTGLGTVTVEVASTGGGSAGTIANGIEYLEFNNWLQLMGVKVYGTFIASKALQGQATLTSVELPDTLETIDADAFNGCSKLTLTEFPDSVTSIQSNAFRGCTNITLTKLPSNVEIINNYAFYNCSNIDISVIPASVREIGKSIFYGCEKLQTITFEGTPASISNSMFVNTSVTTINVPWAEGEVANAPWGATKATINYNYTGE